jgi:hypothetical protein
MMMSAGFLAGFDTGRRRALSPAGLGGAVFLVALAALAALAERQSEWFGAASRALAGIVFGVLIPVALLASSTRVLLPMRLAASASLFARFGASRRSVAFGFIVASMCAAAIFAALAGAVTALVAHDPTAPPRVVDALTTGWIGLLTGLAYAALFAFGATFGAKGGGRYWALALDFVLGGAGGASSLFSPRAHVENLLGGAPPLMLSQPASIAALVALAGGLTVLALARLRP